MSFEAVVNFNEDVATSDHCNSVVVIADVAANPAPSLQQEWVHHSGHNHGYKDCNNDSP